VTGHPTANAPRGKRVARIAVGALIVATIVLAVPRCAHFIAVDSCLDNGGAWDHARDRCIH